jgi:uncharacterized membrane protein YhaH (DUF805 family)
MNGQVEFAQLFLSAKGRLSRTPFLVGSACLIAAVVLYESVVGVTLHWLTGWVVYPVVFFCGACVLSKRLHDRGHSGWLAGLILAALVAVWPQPYGFFDFLFSLVIFWAAVELGVLSGEQGENRFGTNPLRHRLP